MLLPALGYLIYVESQGIGALGQDGWNIRLLLMATGVVTVAPIWLFNAAAPLIPRSLHWAFCSISTLLFNS